MGGRNRPAGRQHRRPDLDAFYWADELSPTASTRIEIAGRFPSARYFSFHVYDASGDALGSSYDQQITAARGSQNPYRHAVPRGAPGNYTLYVDFAPRPRRAASDTLYVDPAQAGGVALLVYRVYVPRDPGDPSGGVGFPQVTVQTADGRRTLATQAPCATTPPPFGSLIWQQFADADYPSVLPTESAGATRIPTWTRSFGSKLGNQQNAYLGALISREFGDMVVIHARVPTFPDSRRGVPVYRGRQVRYWSFCTYDQNGEAGFGCAADYGAAVRKGYVTYVISDPGVRPPNATVRDGVTWLPWGGNQSTAQIVERNMLPTRGFHHAVQQIATPQTSPRRAMGAYYPTAVYCAPARFARGGWRACFRAAGLRPGG